MIGPAEMLQDPIWAGRGTTALIAFLRASAPEGSGVLVPVNLCAIAVAGILWAGMRPVFHDVSPAHGNAEPEHLDEVDTSGCTVLLAVHNFGRALDLAAFRTFADAHRLLLVEDACNAFGACHDGVPVGRLGDATLYSFNGGKIVDCGHGGAITVRDPDMRARVAALIADMPAHDAEHDLAITELEKELRAARQAGSASAQRAAFERYRPFAEFRPAAHWPDEVMLAAGDLAANTAHRQTIAAHYRAVISHPDVAHIEWREGDVPWRHSILVPPQRRDALLAFMRSENVPCSAWYPPVHDIFASGASARYPGAERFAASVVNLWTDEATTHADAERASALINRFMENVRA